MPRDAFTDDLHVGLEIAVDRAEQISVGDPTALDPVNLARLLRAYVGCFDIEDAWQDPQLRVRTLAAAAALEALDAARRDGVGAGGRQGASRRRRGVVAPEQLVALRAHFETIPDALRFEAYVALVEDLADERGRLPADLFASMDGALPGQLAARMERLNAEARAAAALAAGGLAADDDDDADQGEGKSS